MVDGCLHKFIVVNSAITIKVKAIHNHLEIISVLLVNMVLQELKHANISKTVTYFIACQHTILILVKLQENILHVAALLLLTLKGRKDRQYRLLEGRSERESLEVLDHIIETGSFNTH